MNLRSVYGIYSQLDKFLDDEPAPPPNRIQEFKQSITNYGEKLKSQIRGRTDEPNEPPQVQTNTPVQRVQTQPRSTSLWGKIERTWDDVVEKKQTQPNNVTKPPPSPQILQQPSTAINQRVQATKQSMDLAISGNKQRSIFGGQSRSPNRGVNDFENIKNFSKRFEVVNQEPTNGFRSQNLPNNKKPNQTPQQTFNDNPSQEFSNHLPPQHSKNQPPSQFVNRNDLRKRGLSFNDSKVLSFEDASSNLSLDAFLQDETINDNIGMTLKILRKETFDPTIEEVFYLDEGEAKVLDQMIRKLGQKPTIDKVGQLLENLQIKDNFLKQQIAQKAGENQHLFGKGFVLVDSIVFRVNSCYQRIQRSRESIKMIKEFQINLGTKIQTKLKKQKEMDQNLQFMRKFRDRYHLIFDLIKELSPDDKFRISPDSLTLEQIKVTKEKVLKGLKDHKEQQFMESFMCFTNIKSTINDGYRQMLENSYEFFTTHIIKVERMFDGEQLSLTICRMSDLMNEFLMEENALKFNLQIALRKQFKAILSQRIQQKAPFKTLEKLINYLKSFLLSFYEFAYSLNNVCMIMEQAALRQSQTFKKLSSNFQTERQDFWRYTQNKLIKVIKSMKFQSIVDCDLWNYLILFDRIVKIGEEMSSQSSEKILSQLDSSIRALIQVLGFSITEILQSGSIEMTRHTRFQTPQMFTQQILGQKRIQQKSTYLQKYYSSDELLQGLLTQPIQGEQDEKIDTEKFRNKNYQLNVIQQLQRLQVVGEALPYLAFDCFLYALNSFDVFCLLQLKRNVPTQSFSLLMKQININKNIGLEDLASQHSTFLLQYQYKNLRQLIFRSNNLIQSKSINLPSLGSEQPQSIFDFLLEGFSPICDDKSLLQQQVEKQNLCLKEMRDFIVKQNAWVSYTLDTNLFEQSVMQFRIAKQNQLLGQPQWIVDLNSQTLIQKMITKGVPQILQNKQQFIKVVQEINRIGNTKDLHNLLLQQFLQLLDKPNVNDQQYFKFTSILQNKLFPLEISIQFIDMRNPSQVKQILHEYTEFIQSYL